MEKILDTLNTALEAIEDNGKRTDELSGVPSGFVSLDKITSGWEKSDLIVIASRPSMGKTAFTLSVARNTSVSFKIPTLFISLEMSGVQIANKLMCMESELSLEKIRTGQLAYHEWCQLDAKIKNIQHATLFLQTKLFELSAIKKECQEFKSQHNDGLIIIDNLQQIINSEKQYVTREHELGDIVRELKRLAMDLELPIIITASLNRALEMRGGDMRPRLSDLKDTGEIENIADSVIFVYRPEYYGIQQDEEGNSTMGLGQLIVAKNRYGDTCDVNLRFRKEFGRFEEWDSMGLAELPWLEENITTISSSMNGSIEAPF